MRDDYLVRVDHGEAARLDVLLLREGEEHIQEALVHLQHFDELHHAAVSDVKLAVEAVGAGVRLRAVLAYGREIDGACKLRYVLRLGVGGCKGTDAHALLLGEDDAADGHLLYMSPVGVVQFEPAVRAKISLDINAVLFHEIGTQLVRNKVKRLLLHGTAYDAVDGTYLVSGVCLQATLEHGDYSALAAAHGAHQQQNALAHLEPLGSRIEILHDLLERLLQTVDFAVEEVVGGCSTRADPHSGGHYRVKNTSMGELGYLRVLLHYIEVVGESTFPGQRLLLRSKLL